MKITMLKSKIHRVKVTECDLNYEGSITIDETLMKAANIIPYEKVQVVNCNNGERLETYAIPGKKGTGVIALNGAGARKAMKDDIIIIMTYVELDPHNDPLYEPKIVKPDSNNKLVN